MSAISDSRPQVLIEIQSGEGLGLAKAGSLVPSTNPAGSGPSTIWRWIQKGSKHASGQVIRLEGCKIGGRWFTSRPALARFIAALSATDSTSTTPIRTPAARQKASEAAERELIAAGC